MSEDKNWSVCRFVAQNPNTSSSVLEKLSRAKHWYVRSFVAENPNTSLEVLETLSRDKALGVRFEVFNNANISISILEKLSGDSEWEIRKLALQNPKNIRIREMMKVGRVKELEISGGGKTDNLNIVWLRRLEEVLFKIGAEI